MPTGELLLLVAIFFLTSVISVVPGSTLLITVPVMIALGIEAHVAVATNMLALTFMSVGGSLPFIGRNVLSRSRLLPSIVLIARFRSRKACRRIRWAAHRGFAFDSRTSTIMLSSSLLVKEFHR